MCRSPGRRKLVCSPDTDVYHIGLPIIQSSQQNVFIQLSKLASPEVRLLHLNHLCSDLAGDPDLALTSEEIQPNLLQSLFICTGCDYISFFSGIGKASFLRIFFQYSSFVNANSADYPGHLANMADNLDSGFLAFVRLVGTAYFKKYLSAFKYDSPRTLLNSCQQSSPEETHKYWLDTIRDTVWERTEFEDDLPPSFEALWRHWLRSCWVSNMWSQATSAHYHLLPLNEYGWRVSDNELSIDWDDPTNIQKVRNTVHLLLKGCSCKKGCKTRRCGCLKEGRKCGPGCTCSNCENTPFTGTTPTGNDEVETEELQEDLALREQYANHLVDDDDDECDVDAAADEDAELDMYELDED